MRRLPLYLLLIAGVAQADEGPFLRLGARFATGISVQGESGNRWTTVPISAGVGGEYAFAAQPWTVAFGEVYAEGPHKLGVAVAGGTRVYAMGRSVRLGVGATAFIKPAAKYGATASLGTCLGARLCADMSGTLFFAGEGLEDNAAAAQLKLVLDVGFDVL